MRDPAVCYVDHCSDFTSRHLEQVAADLKVRLVFSTIGQPRGRGKIERHFNSVNQLCLAQLPGYAPAGTPDRAARARLSLAELDAALGRFIVTEYNQRPHSETGQPPQQRWEAGGWPPHMPDSLQQLDLLLLTVARPRKVHPDGIHFQGLRYLDPTLAAYVGEPVTIRYDPRDLAELRVFHDDTFVCRAVSPELAGTTISLKEIIHARNEHRRQLREHLTDRTCVIDQLLAVHAPQTPPASAPPRGDPSTTTKLRRYRDD